MCLVSKRLQFQNFDGATCPSAFFCFFKEALQQSHYLKNGAVCMVTLVLGQEYSGQGDVLELAQVAEVVIDG